MTEKEILQLIVSPETDSDRVLRLAAEHNTDLHGWCTHRKQRGHIATVAVATSLLAVSFLIPHRSDTFVSGDLQCCTADACLRVDQMIAKI